MTRDSELAGARHMLQIWGERCTRQQMPTIDQCRHGDDQDAAKVEKGRTAFARIWLKAQDAETARPADIVSARG